jgi:hypothetical protein
LVGLICPPKQPQEFATLAWEFATLDTLYTHLTEQCPSAVGSQFQLRAEADYYIWALAVWWFLASFFASTHQLAVATFGVANHMPMPVKRKEKKY